MKKTILYLFTLAIGLIGLYSCEDPYANQMVAEPTIFEQPAIQDANFKASVLTNPLTITQDKIGKTFSFIKVDSRPTLVDTTAHLEYKVILSNTSDFATFKFLPVTYGNTTAGSELVANYTTANDTLKALNPSLTEHPAYARVLAYIVSGGIRALYTTSNIAFNVKSYNFPPVAVNDTVIAIKDMELTYNVLNNDSDPEGDQLMITAVGTPANGKAIFSGSSVIYTPNTGYTGTDSFTYTVSDGNSTSTASVVITVTAMKKFTDVAVRPYYIIGLGDGAWNNSVAGLGVSIFPLSAIDGYVYNEMGDGIFIYTGYFEADKGFKLIRDLGNWDEQWGEKGGAYVHNDGGSGNITLTSSGYYTITLNSINNTLTIVPATAPANTYTQIGLIGAFTGWGSDIVMSSWASTNQHAWYKEVTFDSNSEGKFRANADWGLNWGSTTFPVGLGVGNGPNIPVTAGTYTVMFNDIDGCYYFYKK
ncbi:MAG: Ig-like domain-containing protein [Paludibacteraceae bacterium]